MPRYKEPFTLYTRTNASGSVNHIIKIVKIMTAETLRRKLIYEDPSKEISYIDADEQERGILTLDEVDEDNAPYGQYRIGAFQYPIELEKFFAICVSMWTSIKHRKDNLVFLKVVKNNNGEIMDKPVKQCFYRQGEGSGNFSQYLLNSVEIHNLENHKILLDFPEEE